MTMNIKFAAGGHHLVAKKEYGFMESAEVLFSESTRPSIVGRWGIPLLAAFTCSIKNLNGSMNNTRLCRWDWYAWQFFTALIPPFGEQTGLS